jgi:hypothetical protein
MTKAEEQALRVYPYSKGKVVATGFGTIEFDQNHDERDGFIKGYNQAKQDFIEKATKWLKENAANFVSKDNEGEPYLYRIGLADEFIKAMVL